MSAHARDAPDPNDDGWTWPPVPHDLNGLPVVESLDDFEKRVTPLGGFQDAKTALKRPNGVRDRDGGEIVLVNAADIEPEPVSWLWHNGLQISVLNLLAGRPGSGKSTIALSWCATVTGTGKWPDGQVCSTPGRAVYWSGEDGIKDTLLPRFIAAGGNRVKMSFIEGVCAGEHRRPFDPAADMPKLAHAVEKLGDERMIVLDPIAVMLKGADSHKKVETRIGLQPFADLCASRGACGLGVHHFTKNTEGGDPLDRISGSLAFGALPRCGWVAAKDLNAAEAARRVLLRVKMSNGPIGAASNTSWTDASWIVVLASLHNGCCGAAPSKEPQRKCSRNWKTSLTPAPEPEPPRSCKLCSKTGRKWRSRSSPRARRKA